MALYSVTNQSIAHMTDNSVLDLDIIFSLFEQHEIFAHPSEFHGAITGFLAGGMPVTSQNWLGALSDYYHQGMEFPAPVKDILKMMFKVIWQGLNDDNLAFELLLPVDEAPLTDRSTALGGWTQGFLLGIGTNIDTSKNALKDASDDVNEVVQDFAQICKMAEDIEENEENEAAYFEIYEYVRISAVMCFSELGFDETQSRDKITLH